METTSNDLIPNFDRFSGRLSRFYSPNLGDLQKQRSSIFFSGELQIFSYSKNIAVLEPRTGIFRGLEASSQGLQNVFETKNVLKDSVSAE